MRKRFSLTYDYLELAGDSLAINLFNYKLCLVITVYYDLKNINTETYYAITLKLNKKHNNSIVILFYHFLCFFLTFFWKIYLKSIVQQNSVVKLCIIVFIISGDNILYSYWIRFIRRIFYSLFYILYFFNFFLICINCFGVGVLRKDCIGNTY